MNNLAVIDNLTHEVKVFKGRTLVQKNTFNTSLDAEQVEAYRVDPVAFTGGVPKAVTEEFEPAVA